ncbi:hypothetical protein EVAR_22462_1 [Eumeta japonica]|uniref:Uncharacterized protein n=1 Tax=Eumeta variegata TaxID=151549 RepID=A0A4C1VCS3_EUMVA|nr:hypothetical protein EVAR_22462_1 [Eumeta japonica]
MKGFRGAFKIIPPGLFKPSPTLDLAADYLLRLTQIPMIVPRAIISPQSGPQESATGNRNLSPSAFPQPSIADRTASVSRKPSIVRRKKRYQPQNASVAGGPPTRARRALAAAVAHRDRPRAVLSLHVSLPLYINLPQCLHISTMT